MRKPEAPVIARTLSVVAASALLASCGGHDKKPTAKESTPTKNSCPVNKKRLGPGGNAFLAISGGRMINVINAGNYKDAITGNTTPHTATIELDPPDPVKGDGHIPRPLQFVNMALNFETSGLVMEQASEYRTDVRRIGGHASKDVEVSICRIQPEGSGVRPYRVPQADPAGT